MNIYGVVVDKSSSYYGVIGIAGHNFSYYLIEKFWKPININTKLSNFFYGV